MLTTIQYLTWGVLYWELIGWFFLVMPWKTRASTLPTSSTDVVCIDVFRLIGIAGFFSLHAGFGSCMRLEQFVWVRDRSNPTLSS